MAGYEILEVAAGAVRGHRLRSALSMLGIAIGIAAVVLLSSIGEGVHRYVFDSFNQFGTNILEVTPGSTETIGIPGVLGGSTNLLTVEDAEAVGRLPEVRHVMPLAFGQARVEAGELGRSVYVYGATSELPPIWRFEVRQGSFLPPGDPRRGGYVAVLGTTVKQELFGDANALGAFVRVGGTRFRVIGVMEPKGRILGFDMDDAVYVPTATVMRMFNLDQVAEIEVVYAESYPVERVVESVRALMLERHRGNDDFTITTQTAMLDTLGNVMNALKLAVGAIAGISLLVGAIGILTVMWIAVSERTAEIGLLRAIGATPRQVLRMFLIEAAMLAGVGGAIGLLFGLAVAWLLRAAVAGLPVHTPVSYAIGGLVTSVLAGLLSGILPARRAARLDPIVALKGE